MTPKPARVHKATFEIQGAEFLFEMFRINAAKYVFQVKSNQPTENPDQIEYQSQLNGKEAPNHFLAEIVTFLANRFQVKLHLQDTPPPPPPKTKLESLKAIPE